jgi:hypothetical protein
MNWTYPASPWFIDGMTYACCLDDGDACKGAEKKQMVAGK